jgi:hypothetical protein
MVLLPRCGSLNRYGPLERLARCAVKCVWSAFRTIMMSCFFSSMDVCRLKSQFRSPALGSFFVLQNFVDRPSRQPEPVAPKFGKGKSVKRSPTSVGKRFLRTWVDSQSSIRVESLALCSVSKAEIHCFHNSSIPVPQRIGTSIKLSFASIRIPSGKDWSWRLNVLVL